MAQQRHTTQAPEPAAPTSPSGPSSRPSDSLKTPAPTGPEVPHQRFGRFILLNKLGAGGMAEVSRAVVMGAEEFQRVVVVKRILPRLSADPTFVKMFIDEATLCGRLSHPNIIQVHEFGQHSRQFFIAMEYVHGRSLSDILRRLRRTRQGLPFTIAAEILRQVCHGLAYAHTLTAADGRPLGIIHRDVSPGNVIVAFNGAVKLLDFGIARVEARFRRAETQPGQVKGKSAYLSPEQVSSQPVDYRADIFAAGIVLYELVTGRRLFKAASPLECIDLIRSLRVPLPSQVDPNVPARLESIVLRALRRAPEERFQSANEMADDLEAFLRDRQGSSWDLPTFVGRLFADEAGDNPGHLTSDEEQAVLAATGRGPRITTEYPVARPSPTGGMGAVTSAEPSIVPETGTPTTDTELRLRLPHWHRGLWLATAAVAVVCVLVVLQHTLLRPVDPAAASRNALAASIAVARATATARPAVQAAPIVTLSVDSDPPGALVVEQGTEEPLGKTPLRVTRPASDEPLRYEITKKGYIDGVLQVVPDADKLLAVPLARRRPVVRPPERRPAPDGGP